MEDPDDNPDGDHGILMPPAYVMALGEKLPGIVAEMLVVAMMEDGTEDPRNAELYALRKTQITWGAGKVEPGEVERCIAGAPPWAANVYEHHDQEARLRRMLARRGFALSRSRRRDLGALDFGRYEIREAETGIAVELVLSLELAEYWVAEYDRSRADQEA